MISFYVSKLEINNSSFTPSMNKLASYYPYLNCHIDLEPAGLAREASDKLPCVVVKRVASLGFGKDVRFLLFGVHMVYS
jgi:hypothetical protein